MGWGLSDMCFDTFEWHHHRDALERLYISFWSCAEVFHYQAIVINLYSSTAQRTSFLFFSFQVYLLGDVGVEEELDLKGIAHLGGPADGDHKVELKPGYAMPHDPEVTHTQTATMNLCTRENNSIAVTCSNHQSLPAHLWVDMVARSKAAMRL